MKSHDLRIGNYIKLKEKEQPYQIDHPHDLEELWDRDFEGCKGVLLTADLLIKLNFIKCEGRHGTYFKHKVMDAFRVWWNEDLESWSVGRKDYKSIDKEYNTYWIRDNIKTLHLLQNIFFDLTDAELTLNN